MADAENSLSFNALLAAPGGTGIGRKTQHCDFLIVRIPDNCSGQYSVVDAYTCDEAARFSVGGFAGAKELRE